MSSSSSSGDLPRSELGSHRFSLRLAAPRHPGEPTDHFDGKHFFNAVRRPSFGFLPVLRWGLTRHPGPWPKWIPSTPGPKPPVRVDDLRVTFINHATVLIQVAGLNLLTDPIWSKRCSPVSFAGPIRHRDPGLRFEDLPPIDLVLISHDHYDHMDMPTLRRLTERDHPVILAGLGSRAILERAGIRGSVDMDWWDEVTIGSSSVVCAPAQHFSGRSLFNRDAVLWCGFLLRTPRGNVFFAGDTAYAPHYKEIREKFGPTRLALLPIGAYLPAWFMRPVHMSPDEAVQASGDLEAGTGMGIHFGCFRLADEGYSAPAERIAEIFTEGMRPFWLLAEGQGRDVPPLV